MSPTARAKELPEWEAGIGVGALFGPHYRGSDYTRRLILPFPYVIYRGDWLKADRDGARARFFNADVVDLNLNLSASPPVSSQKDPARAGMPDLRATLELGTQLQVRLWQTDNRRDRLYFRLPVRAGMSIPGAPRYAGLVAEPNVNLDISDVGGVPGLSLGMLTGPIFGSQRQHAYFYDVAPEFARPNRPSYAARGGYAGTQAIIAMSRRSGSLFAGAFVRWDSLAGAVFADSPLVRRRQYVVGGFAVAWVFGKSDKLVNADD